MASPTISVLIPVYNGEKYIALAIESVLAQTFTDFEIIIVDNCSTDSSFEIASKYTTDERVKLFRNENNIGMVRNWNQCILHASGNYLKFLFADDYFKSNALEEFVAPFKADHTISLVLSTREYIFDDGHTIEYPVYFKGFRKGEIVINECVSQNLNPLGEPSFIMFRRQDLNAGLFNTDMFWMADIDYWLRLCSVGNVFSINRSYVLFRKHAQQATEQIVTNERFFNEERNTIYYNFFIRRSSNQNRYKDYIKAVWANVRYHLYRTSYSEQKKYLEIWPAMTSIKYQSYFFLHMIYRAIKGKKKFK